MRKERAKAGDVLPTILIVDDNRANLLAIEAVLQPLGYPILAVASGEEALKRALAQEIAMVIMDVHMSGLDGYQTTALLREREGLQDVPVIFLTAVYNQPEHTHRGYALGAVDYISKPFDIVVLRAKVRALVSLYLRGQRAERARSDERERTKDLFMGAVGHDLRNPLNAIVMASEMVSTDPCSVPSHDVHAHWILRGAMRMNRIIEDILDLTRNQFTDGIPVRLQPMDLEEMCRSQVEEFRVAHRRRVIDLEVAGEVKGAWDADRLGRVVSNLVGNAVQHGEGPIRISVRDEGERVVLVVHNGGKPIPTEEQRWLFDPFRHGELSSKGLGLGLYIAREIVRAHRGDIAVESTLAHGTSFSVTLPKSPRTTSAAE